MNDLQGRRHHRTAHKSPSRVSVTSFQRNPDPRGLGQRVSAENGGGQLCFSSGSQRNNRIVYIVNISMICYFYLLYWNIYLALGNQGLLTMFSIHSVQGAR